VTFLLFLFSGSCSATLYLFIFFFQAEDGIRDRNVTGVQTCALPISKRVKDIADFLQGTFNIWQRQGGEKTESFAIATNNLGYGRSEERRVGKGWRSPGSPAHEKRKRSKESRSSDCTRPRQNDGRTAG